LRTQVGIVGAGPAGLLLAEILHQQGVDSIVVEKHSREHVLSRIRAGVLEPTTVDVLRANGLATRLDREGHVHDGVRIVRAGGGGFLIDIHKHCGKRFVAYGQTNLQEDLFAAADRRGAAVITEAADVRIEGTSIVFATGRVDCDFIAGCDGFHGVSRSAIPQLREYEKVYPFGWLGILSETPPLPEIAYCHSPRGFALASQRSPRLSRYYLQVPLDTRIEDWPDARFWTELKARFPRDWADAITTGSSIEKSIAPLRSYVAEPMHHGRLFLAGDAAHIVPPTGAKGLNLAVSDVFYLARALAEHYRSGSMALLDTYSETALCRVWASVRISWYLTMLLHRFPEASAFDQRAQEVELEILESSPQAQAALAEQYAGLPL
jgi:p-hydroxybenzoate 3-monooxygenase